GQYPLTGRGRVNTYSVFAERMRRLLKPGGRAGIIVPTGIATDDTNKHFFADLVESGSLVSLFDFENREAIFPHVHRSYKFSLLTMGKPVTPGDAAPAELAFFCTRAAHLQDDRRRFTLSPADIARINPNTRTLPVFRTRQDAELTRAIYARVPVLVNERTGENPWGVRFLRMFDMSNDSHLFRTAAELQAEGFVQVGNVFAPARAGTRPAPTFTDDAVGAGLVPAQDASGLVPGRDSTVGDIVGAFKSRTTVGYIRGIERFDWVPFRGRLWQRNYFEYIIRNDNDLDRIREYIVSNPLRWTLDRENRDATGTDDFDRWLDNVSYRRRRP
ncbi:MAG: hypothetical protein ACUVTW_15345, partial [Thermogutta sp.]